MPPSASFRQPSSPSGSPQKKRQSSHEPTQPNQPTTTQSSNTPSIPHSLLPTPSHLHHRPPHHRPAISHPRPDRRNHRHAALAADAHPSRVAQLAASPARPHPARRLPRPGHHPRHHHALLRPHHGPAERLWEPDPPRPDRRAPHGVPPPERSQLLAHGPCAHRAGRLHLRSRRQRDLRMDRLPTPQRHRLGRPRPSPGNGSLALQHCAVLYCVHDLRDQHPGHHHPPPLRRHDMGTTPPHRMGMVHRRTAQPHRLLRPPRRASPPLLRSPRRNQLLPPHRRPGQRCPPRPHSSQQHRQPAPLAPSLLVLRAPRGLYRHPPRHGPYLDAHCELQPPKGLRLSHDDHHHPAHRLPRNPPLGTPHVRRRPQPLRQLRLLHLHHGHRAARLRRGPELARHHLAREAALHHRHALRPRLRLALHRRWSYRPHPRPAHSGPVPPQHLLRRRPLPPHHGHGRRLRPLRRNLLLVPSSNWASDVRTPRPPPLLAHHRRSLRDLPPHASHRPRRRAPPLRPALRHPRPRRFAKPRRPASLQHSPPQPPHHLRRHLSRHRADSLLHQSPSQPAPRSPLARQPLASHHPRMASGIASKRRL